MSKIKGEVSKNEGGISKICVSPREKKLHLLSHEIVIL
jgi:hypothetical protein